MLNSKPLDILSKGSMEEWNYVGGNMDRLLKNGFERRINVDVNKKILEDIIYQCKMVCAEECGRMLKNSRLSEYQLEVLSQYEEYLKFMNERIRDITYMTGVKDTMLFLKAFEKK